MDNRKMFYGAHPKIFENARTLRERMTLAERHLWERLKGKKLGLRFKAQHPIGNFIVDFYCHRVKLVIEVDGKMHAFQKEMDLSRSFELEEKGICVIRFSNEDVMENTEAVLKKIKEKLDSLEGQ